MSATPLSGTTVNVTWTPPINQIGIDVFYAYTNDEEKQHCEARDDQMSCVISGLQSFTHYEVCVRACHDKAISTEPDDDASGTEAPTLFTSIRGREGNSEIPFCSTPHCNVVQTLPGGRSSFDNVVYKYLQICYKYVYKYVKPSLVCHVKHFN